MSRFRILALFATLIAVTVLFAACGSSDDEGGSSSDDPQQLVENASLEGVKSGEMELSLHATVEGDEDAEADVSLSGPFEAGAKGELPQVELSAEVDASAEDEEISFDGGVTLLTDRAFIEYEGTNYEVDPTTFGFVKAALEQAEQQGGEEDITACQEAAEGIKFSQFAGNLESDGEADVDGTSTTKVSGDLEVDGAIDALIQLTENPACSAQLEAAGPLPIEELEEAKSELSKVVEKAHVDLYVGDDDIVRKMDAELTVAPEGSDEKIEVEFEITLSGVNEEQSFSAPSDTKPLEDLFGQIGVNPLELLEAGGEEGLQGLLEGLMGSAGGGGSSSGGGSESGALPNQRAYLDCLQKAQTTADLQKCANLIE